jgi:hypothetical protein
MKKECIFEESEFSSDKDKPSEINISYMFSLIKDIYFRLSELENKFYNSSKDKSLNNSLDSLKTYDIFEKKTLNSNINTSDNLSSFEKFHQSNEFLRDMIDKDKDALFNKTLEAQVMKEMFSPIKSSSFNLEQFNNDFLIKSSMSSKKFFKDLSSENLLDIFSEKNIAKNNKFLDIFLTTLPSLRSMTNYYTLLEEKSLTKVIDNSKDILSNLSELSKTEKSKKIAKPRKTTNLEKTINSKNKSIDKSKNLKSNTKKSDINNSKKQNKKLNINNDSEEQNKKLNINDDSKNSLSRQLSRKLVMQYVQQGMEFYFSSGVIVKSIHELYVYLNSSNESIFYEHVNNYKNDFAQWISKALGYKRFGELVSRIKDRKGFLTLLKDVVM